MATKPRRRPYLAACIRHIDALRATARPFSVGQQLAEARRLVEEHGPTRSAAEIRRLAADLGALAADLRLITGRTGPIRMAERLWRALAAAGMPRPEPSASAGRRSSYFNSEMPKFRFDDLRDKLGLNAGSYGPWAVLGVPPSSSLEDLKAAYRRLALVHHPDRGGCAEKFDAMVKAYELAVAHITQ